MQMLPNYTDEEIKAAETTAKVFAGETLPGSENYFKRVVWGALLGLKFKREDKINNMQSFVATVGGEDKQSSS